MRTGTRKKKGHEKRNSASGWKIGEQGAVFKFDSSDAEKKTGCNHGGISYVVRGKYKLTAGNSSLTRKEEENTCWEKCGKNLASLRKL